MKIASLTVLHYGREWLEWALRAVEPFVDESHIFYTPHPSHGQRTKSPCPDSREELHDIASFFPNVHWHDVDQFWVEGEHRDYAKAKCFDAGADLILVVDADEVWDPDYLDQAIQQAYDGPEAEYMSRVAGHFWRGVNWVCHDECVPVRLFKHGVGLFYLEGPGFWHFGYAISNVTMLYKLKIHGHRAELRERWYPDVYRDWDPEIVYKCGVHPTNECDSTTGKSFWTPEPFDRNEVAHLIGDSPYFNDDYV